MEKGQLKERLSTAAGMPRDVTMKAPVLTVLGDFELSAENYRGITEYTDCLVRIQTRSGQIRVTGRRLHVEYYTSDEMKVTGKIETIDFAGRKGKTDGPDPG
ncbi:MAG TPA: YabP/YqfC family sporulation protein [Candidatus Mediterraneibacter merdipullorum]|nr:YabP/YqfC family sporulation protein [Candidatus Mediterraneibacter merdipullorum]